MVSRKGSSGEDKRLIEADHLTLEIIPSAHEIMPFVHNRSLSFDKVAMMIAHSIRSSLLTSNRKGRRMTSRSSLIALIGRHPLLIYVLIAFLWSWAWWIPATLAFKGVLSLSVSWPMLLIIGGPGPTISAIALTSMLDGIEGMKNLLRKFLTWRVNFAWYLFALITPSALLVCAMAIYTFRGGSLGRIDWDNWPMLLTAIVVALPYGPVSEELGWRGYMLPRLQRSYNPLLSSIILGAIWMLWHTPLFWLPGGAAISGAAITVFAVLWYLAYLIGWSILFTWMYNNTHGSVLLAFLLHGSLNAGSVLTLFPDLPFSTVRNLLFLTLIPLAAGIVMITLLFSSKPLSQHRDERAQEPLYRRE
jgi:membrane protease YdiL (CAAX protease family)